MLKFTFIVILAFIIGVVISRVFLSDAGIEGLEVSSSQLKEVSPVDTRPALKSPFSIIENQQADPQLQLVLKQLDGLEQRITMLEQMMPETSDVPEPHSGFPQVGSNTGSTQAARVAMLTEDVLIKAGLDQHLASEIVRNRNQFELQKLELRDRAIRENYLNSERYRDELASLNQNQVSLREELGDKLYDQYLYASGAANRVRAVSVMADSAAELAGMQAGDLIIKYGEETIFDWSALRKATSEGERGEYINVEVMRGTEPVSLWVLRGPLGIRLGTTRVDPGG